MDEDDVCLRTADPISRTPGPWDKADHVTPGLFEATAFSGIGLDKETALKRLAVRTKACWRQNASEILELYGRFPLLTTYWVRA